MSGRRSKYSCSSRATSTSIAFGAGRPARGEISTCVPALLTIQHTPMPCNNASVMRTSANTHNAKYRLGTPLAAPHECLLTRAAGELVARLLNTDYWALPVYYSINQERRFAVVSIQDGL